MSKATLKFIPSPTGFRGGTPFFSTSSEKRRVNDDKTGYRVNFNTKSTGEWAVYYHYDTARLYNRFAGGNVPGFAGNVPARAQRVNLSHTKAFGTTMVNEVRLN